MVPNTSKPDSSTAQDSPRSEGAWRIKLLYDGECPLCLREVNFLKQRDGGRGRVAFVDIAAANYRPEENGGVDFETAMGRIHAILPDGSVIKNVEVFRQVYEVLGMGWIYAATRWPVIRPIVDKIYEIWADRRLALTGRPGLETIMAQRQAPGCGSGEDSAEGQRCRLS
ncbi:MAG: thiol-disulfide oxidoreductase DCC family protein [Elainellaceae cyanobacterium]